MIVDCDDDDVDVVVTVVAGDVHALLVGEEGPLGLLVGGDLGSVLEKAGVDALQGEHLNK